MFALVYGPLLRPLPYPDERQLIMLGAAASSAQLPEWRARLTTCLSVSGYERETLIVRGAGEARPVPAAVVDDQFFDTVGMPPLAGRTFGALHESAVAVVSERFARDLASAGGAVLGRHITAGNAPVTVVGVMPPQFGFPAADTDLWVPARAVAAIHPGGSADERRFQLLARLKGGAAIAAARTEVASARRALDPRGRTGAGAGVERLHDKLAAPVRPALLAFGAAAALVLLIACANVAMILIGRTIARRRELAIRRAVGASLGQAFATIAAEAALIVAGGAALGIVLASAAVRQLEALTGASLQRAVTSGWTGRSLVSPSR